MRRSPTRPTTRLCRPRGDEAGRLRHGARDHLSDEHCSVRRSPRGAEGSRDRSATRRPSTPCTTPAESVTESARDAGPILALPHVWKRRPICARSRLCHVALSSITAPGALRLNPQEVRAQVPRPAHPPRSACRRGASQVLPGSQEAVVDVRRTERTVRTERNQTSGFGALEADQQRVGSPCEVSFNSEEAAVGHRRQEQLDITSFC